MGKIKIHPYLANCILLIFSIVISLSGFEIFLRNTRSLSEIYQGLWYVPSVMETVNKYNFVTRYRHKMNNLKNYPTYDDRLGWDYNIENGLFRGCSDLKLKKSENVRILFIGDSMTYGTGVEGNQTFPCLVGQAGENVETLNMGVPGYGTDQAILKYLYYGKDYNPDIVVLGIYNADYRRNSIRFFSYEKPRFILNDEEGGRVTLENSQIPKPDVRYEELEREIGWKLYFVALWEATFYSFKIIRVAEIQRYFDRMDRITEYFLSMLHREVTGRGGELYILEIPSGLRFFNQKKYKSHMKGDNEFNHLRNIYEKLNIPHVLLSEAFLLNNSYNEIYENLYIHEEGGGIGHLTRKGNREVARIILECLSDGSYCGTESSFGINF